MIDSNNNDANLIPNENQISSEIIPSEVSNPNANIEEVILEPKNGCCFLGILIATVLILIGAAVGIGIAFVPLIGIPILLIFFTFFCCCGLSTVEPNQAVVLMFCGSYIGTVKKNGFYYINPFYSKTYLSLKAETFNTPIIKVNDKIGNPINVGCVVIWRVNECNKALFDVQNYHSYLKDQSESAIRQVCCMYNYDKHEPNEISLRSGDEVIHQALVNDLSQRLKIAGIKVEEARITELSYSSEISNSMLKSQAAEAVVAAREKIVRGAVDIVQQTVVEMETKNICKMDDNNKARMVGNLMVILCSDTQATPTVNTGFN